MTQPRLYHIPTDAVPALRTAYDEADWFYCISEWNKYQVTDPKLCYCISGENMVREHLPNLQTHYPDLWTP